MTDEAEDKTIATNGTSLRKILFIVILRRTFLCLLFALAAGCVFLSMDGWICGEKNGQNAAGGGSAIGMLAMAIVGIAWPVLFAVLNLFHFAEWTGILKWTLSWKKELLILSILLILWAVAVALFVKSLC
jgi:hypothetical protein